MRIWFHNGENVCAEFVFAIVWDEGNYVVKHLGKNMKRCGKTETFILQCNTIYLFI